ncbi:MAG: Asp23/Gls24 family envelope stress response protein [Pseudonocardiaceae bacterium]
MSAVTPEATPAATPDTEPVSTEPPPGPVPAEDRGHTTIQPQVFEAMAARIVSEEPGVGGAARRVLGVAMTGEDPERTARVEARLAGDVVTLRVRLSVAYPTPVHDVTDRLRRRLIDRIGELTGTQVGVVEIVVAALHHPATGRRVVR